MGKRRGGGLRKSRAQNWQLIPRENAAWETYYRAQNLLSDEDFDKFKAAAQQDLPLTFRVTGSTAHALEIKEMMEKTYLPQLQGVVWDGVEVPAPHALPYYPKNLAWQVKLGKQVIRRNPPFAKFQRFLVVETEVGNISRQEAVSMIPPLFLDVQPHHTVLDTCASPGSKTAQIIEALHANSAEPTGIVIANDADAKRAHLLTHQIKRLNSPNVLVVNQDAQMFPNIKIRGNQTLRFDRILCDVPCSGDATMRKNVGIWRDWKVGNGIGLHRLQVNITSRGIQMLKPGGRMVYSTCSLNPIEDEAVVAQILRQHPDAHLVDMSDEIPGLVRSPGVNTWKVQGKDKEWHTGPDENLEASLFPPKDGEDFHLERCMRIYPHQQDTGGFFIAVIEKDENPRKKARVESPEPVAAPVSEVVTGDGTTRPDNEPTRLPRDATVDPFFFLGSENETLKKIWDFYKIKDFPQDSLVVRNQTGEAVRTIYYVTPAIKPILELNEEKVKFIYTGLKTFNMQKNDGKCLWRVQSEAVELLYPHVGDDRVLKSENEELFKFLVDHGNPTFRNIKEVDASFAEELDAMTEGCCFFYINGFVCPLWKGKSSVNVMLPKEHKDELLLRKFGIDKKALEKAKLAAAKSEEESAAQTESENKTIE